jgi:outer membrane protein OmpA-like peptidoglycan-associated protein
MKTNNTIIKALTFALVLFFSVNAIAQTKLQQAQTLKMKYDYAQAIKMYTDYFKTTTAAATDIKDLIECYMLLNDTKSAETWFAKLIAKGDYTAQDVLHYAGILKTNGKYDNAILQYESFATMHPTGKDTADAEIASCKTALTWIADPDYFIVANAAAFNSDNSDFGAIKFKDGYIFTSDREETGKVYANNEIYGWTDKPYLKLYYLDGINGSSPASQAELIDNLNAKYQNGAAVYDDKNSTIYFTRTKMVRTAMRPINSDPTSWYDHSTTKNYVNRWEIYSAKYSSGKWDDVKAFDFNNAENYSIGHPAVSPDGKTLYFVSDMPGGFGKTDIYFCTKETDGSWSKPRNAGSQINTEGRECFPSVDQDGKLYFSSDGLPGMGGLDMFSAEGSENGWTDPVNLKYPLNSSKDDFSIYFTATGSAGYFSSDRDGGQGLDDIYSFTPEARTLILAGTTNEKIGDKTSTLGGVSVLLGNTTSGDNKLLTSDPQGKFYSTLDCGAEYHVNGELEGYISEMKNLSPLCRSRHDTVYVDLDLSRKIVYLVGVTREKLPDGTLAALSGVNIVVENAAMNSNIPAMTSDKKGGFGAKLECSSDYEVTASIDGYFTQSKELKSLCRSQFDTVYVEFDMEKIVINKPIVIKNIYYDFDKWNIRPDAALELDKLVSTLTLNPQINIELGSHTDCRGTFGYNDVLSQKRAESAVAYIISKGIAASRITAKGYGEKVPVNKCVDGVSCTEDEFQLNRRTEFKVTSIIQNATSIDK